MLWGRQQHTKPTWKSSSVPCNASVLRVSSNDILQFHGWQLESLWRHDNVLVLLDTEDSTVLVWAALERVLRTVDTADNLSSLRMGSHAHGRVLATGELQFIQQFDFCVAFDMIQPLSGMSRLLAAEEGSKNSAQTYQLVLDASLRLSASAAKHELCRRDKRGRVHRERG